MVNTPPRKRGDCSDPAYTELIYSLIVNTPRLRGGVFKIINLIGCRQDLKHPHSHAVGYSRLLT